MVLAAIALTLAIGFVDIKTTRERVSPVPSPVLTALDVSVDQSVRDAQQETLRIMSEAYGKKILTEALGTRDSRELQAQYGLPQETLLVLRTPDGRLLSAAPPGVADPDSAALLLEKAGVRRSC
jgi:hypothetical protein